MHIYHLQSFHKLTDAIQEPTYPFVTQIVKKELFCFINQNQLPSFSPSTTFLTIMRGTKRLEITLPDW